MPTAGQKPVSVMSTLIGFYPCFVSADTIFTSSIFKSHYANLCCLWLYFLSLGNHSVNLTDPLFISAQCITQPAQLHCFLWPQQEYWLPCVLSNPHRCSLSLSHTHHSTKHLIGPPSFWNDKQDALNDSNVLQCLCVHTHTSKNPITNI